MNKHPLSLERIIQANDFVPGEQKYPLRSLGLPAEMMPGVEKLNCFNGSFST